MPTDVKLGEGYDGAILMQRFPNQYRDPRVDVQEYSGGYYQYPGAISGQPRATDPDQGRPMAMVDMPGVGKVMVPVEDAAAMMGNVNAVVPVDHSMVGQVYPAEHEMAEFLDEQQLRGLGDADHKSAVNWIAQKLSRAAGKAAVEALKAIKAGKFKTIEQFEAYIQQVVTRVATRIEAHLKAKLAALPSFRDSAIKVAIDSARAKAVALLSKPSGSGDWYGSMMGASGDWPGSMMGGLTDAIGSLVAGESLDKLNRAVGQLQDATAHAYDQLDAVKAAEKQVAELAALPGNFASGPFGSKIPTAQGVLYLQALAAIKQGYNALTGFEYMTEVFYNTLIMRSGPKLSAVYSGISGLKKTFENWYGTWIGKVKNVVPGQAELWDKIQAEHNRRYIAATGKSPATDAAFDDPLYISTAQEAVATVTGYKGLMPGQVAVGMGDLGLEPVSTTVAIIALIKVIVAAIAIIAIVVGVVSVLKELNYKTRAAYEMNVAYEARKEAERKEYMAKRQAEGAGVQQATAEWNAEKQKADAEQKKKVEALPPGAADVGTEAAKYIAIAAAAIGAIIILPKVFGL